MFERVDRGYPSRFGFAYSAVPHGRQKLSLIAHDVRRVAFAGASTLVASPYVLNFNHLHYFHVTAAEGSVKKASNRLGVSQATISEQVRLLEKELGVRLFNRVPGRLELTELGHVAYEHTTAMFGASQRLTAALLKDGIAAKPPLRVGVSATLARNVAADFLMPVLVTKGCRASIRTGEFVEMLHQLRRGELDLVLGETAVPTGMVGIDAAELHRPLFHAITSLEAEPLGDWQNLAIIEYPPSSAYRWEVEAFLKEKGLRPTPAAEADDAFFMLEAVTRGNFMAFVPLSVARERLEAGQVKSIASVRIGASIHAAFLEKSDVNVVRDAVDRLVAHAARGA